MSGSIRHITAAPEPSDLWIGRSTCARCGTTMTGQYGLRIPRITYSWSDNDKRLIQHALDQMERHLRAAGAKEIFRQEDDTNHLHGTARMGDDPRTSVVNADCRSWDIRNPWVCDESVFPTVGAVNPAETIQALTCRTADRIRQMSRSGELRRR